MFLFIYAKKKKKKKTNLPLSWPPNTYKIHLTKFNSNSHIIGIRGLVIRVLMNKSADE